MYAQFQISECFCAYRRPWFRGWQLSLWNSPKSFYLGPWTTQWLQEEERDIIKPSTIDFNMSGFFTLIILVLNLQVIGNVATSVPYVHQQDSHSIQDQALGWCKAPRDNLDHTIKDTLMSIFTSLIHSFINQYINLFLQTIFRSVGIDLTINVWDHQNICL